jgi:Periplasmic copper-binding protein (NosD)
LRLFALQTERRISDTNGWGIFLEGGSSKRSVTVENSSLRDFSQGGIWTIGTTAAPNLTATIKNNVISSASQSTYNLVVEEGTNATVTGNVVSGGLDGILIVAPEGSVTGNTVFGGDYGIALSVDGVMVKSNNIYGTVYAGIDVDAGSVKVSAIENNTIKTVTRPIRT